MLIVAKAGDTEIHRHNVKFHCQLLLSGSPAHKSEGLVGLMSVIQENPQTNQLLKAGKQLKVDINVSSSGEVLICHFGTFPLNFKSYPFTLFVKPEV